MKARVVEADEREAGQRALLNLGHTFGHAIEACMNFSGRILHGEAVAVGCVMAFELSARMGLCHKDEADRVRSLVAGAACQRSGPAAAGLGCSGTSGRWWWPVRIPIVRSGPSTPVRLQA